MKRLFSLLLIASAALAACDDSTDPEPIAGRVQWHLSATTCAGTGNISLIVDGNVIATETLTAGESSDVYNVTVGQHVIEAREDVVGGFVFSFPNPVTILSGQIFIRELDCM